MRYRAVLVFGVLLGLAACGGDSDPQEDPSRAAPPGTAAPVAPEQGAAGADAAAGEFVPPPNWCGTPHMGSGHYRAR